MTRTAVIVNGTAGGGRCAARVGPYIDQLRAAGLTEVYWTGGPGDATRLARRASDQGFDRVVSVGGDGTLFEVVNGLLPSENRPALGILPLGTGNSFARDFELHQPDPALQALLADQRRPVDVIRARHASGQLFYINLLSIGFSAEAGGLTNRRFKWAGTGGYVFAVLISLVRLQHPRFPLSLDDLPLDERPCTLLSFSNSRFTGGDMMMAPLADPADGKLDVVRVGPMNRLRFLGCFPRIFRGTHGELDEVELGTASRVCFRLDRPVEVMVDGEVLTLQLEELEVLPRALQVVA